ncbi:DUF1707 domain-containing protein [Blastococcus sp. CT_GayMR16]|uniref:DUF1707 SHOCT-like domain-containing protein n=1 Tax=Blastococcus sp. CT_GayMR16 TaxID=2559607 RepID=UPI00107392D4|nr:DUF1707 domain-containing protein [Blastococcus sp. CT_GayMR16]TFV85719.1 DUF1707 domain-containing protein [Blastococcus sp. CT_GayMR16]
MPEPHLRAADADRAAVATVLGRHMADGRLTVDEYDERLARAYAARTYGELAELTADLPNTARPTAATSAPAQPPAPFRGPAGACGPMAGPWAWGGHPHAAWRSWLSTAVIVVAIWAISSIAASSFLYFWPIWVIGPWGAVLLAQTLTGGRDDRHRQRRG